MNQCPSEALPGTQAVSLASSLASVLEGLTGTTEENKKTTRKLDNGSGIQTAERHRRLANRLDNKSESYSGSKHDRLSPRRAQDSTERAGNLVGTLPPPATNGGSRSGAPVLSPTELSVFRLATPSQDPTGPRNHNWNSPNTSNIPSDNSKMLIREGEKKQFSPGFCPY